MKSVLYVECGIGKYSIIARNYLMNAVSFCTALITTQSI